MTDAPDTPANVTNLDTVREAVKSKRRHAAKAQKGAAAPAGSPPTPPPVPPSTSLPERLPPEAPVKALGTSEGVYFYLDSLGQLRRLPEEKHGRLHIISLFGGWGYLRETWPVWTKTADDQWIKKPEFNHSWLAPVLMNTCRDKGVWDPTDKVRGCGTWMEDSGALMMHCGDALFRSSEGFVSQHEAGIHEQADGSLLLYPRRPSLPHPLFEELDDCGPRLMELLETWSWKRRDLDPRIVLGWLVASLLGQAASWRPMMWVTGGKSTGKSTLVRLVEWVQGRGALIKPTNTTQAYVYQRIGDSALPVTLDEFEAKEDNKRQDDVIELMRIAASGGEIGRGGSENNPKTYTMRSCFSAFSILIPPLKPQDASRMAILHLLPLEREDEKGEFDLQAPDDFDRVLGPRGRWSKTGRQLRARVLQQWPRYQKTFNAYFHELTRAGHDFRAASQFGALGAGFDIAMYNALELEHAKDWAKLLPAKDLAETKGYASESEGCLQHLLAATADIVRQGTHETIAYYLQRARRDAENANTTNDPDDAARILAKLGIRVYRDAELVATDAAGATQKVWWVAISSTHPKLAQIFRDTHWKGKPGAPGTWAQALRGLPGAAERAIQMRIDGARHWVTPILYDGVIEPFSRFADADEIDQVDERDRPQTAKERQPLF